MDSIQNMPVSPLGGLSSGTMQGPKPKRNITIKEVENGWVIYFDKNGYAHGEKTHIAKSASEVAGIVDALLD